MRRLACSRPFTTNRSICRETIIGICDLLQGQLRHPWQQRTQSLGRPVSHGCVRLSPSHAATLYRIVKAEGAHISVTGRPSIHASAGDESSAV
ncbi:MAG: L,D-transpeptidase family protein [Methylocystis sp.]|uniref:L,D-transpeptidase family protein n=1 Tax=Methylocystis sp. TaxID=1911079 RepID=UPI003DA66E6A